MLGRRKIVPARRACERLELGFEARTRPDGIIRPPEGLALSSLVCRPKLTPEGRSVGPTGAAAMAS